MQITLTILNTAETVITAGAAVQADAKLLRVLQPVQLQISFWKQRELKLPHIQ